MRLSGTAARAGAERMAGEIDEHGSAVRADTAGHGHGKIIPPYEPGRRLARLQKRETVARSQAIVPYGPGGPGSGTV